jgi:O-antigen/teichoic acid export membrane protein
MWRGPQRLLTRQVCPVVSRPRSGGLLAGTAWNLVGQGLPLLAAVAAIPFLVRLLGLERFGFLALAWVLIGYASLLDLGIGRALIRTVAERLAHGDADGAAARGRVGLSLLLGLGLVAGLVIALLAPTLAVRVLRVPEPLQTEALLALRLLALSLPFVMLTAGYSGLLSAHQAFRPLNLVRLLFSVLSYLAPLALALAGRVELPWVVGAVVVLRVAGVMAFARAASRHCDFRWRPQWPPVALMRELLSLGGWMAVSNIVGPLLTYLDRLLIGALVPIGSVGLYSAPYDLVSRVLVLPYSITSSFMPKVAGLRPGTPESARALERLSRLLFVAMLPVCLVLVALSFPVMELWLGAEASREAAWVLQILAAGVMVNAVSQGPATMIVSIGRPRDLALLHLVQLPVFLAVVWVLTEHMGIVGTALAALIRFVLDAAAVLLVAAVGVGGAGLHWRGAVAPLLTAAGLLALASVCRTWTEALAALMIGSVPVVLWLWRQMLTASEREMAAGVLQRALRVTRS